MKKIAYLISAYTEPSTLENMIYLLNNSEVDFYIHVDKHVDINDFQSQLCKLPNVHFLKGDMRVDVYWGGYSQVKLQYNMIKEMLNSKIIYERVVNLTGTDYPIWSNDKLLEYFGNVDKEYIIGFDVSREKGNKNNQKKYIYIWKLDNISIFTNFLNKLHIKKARNYNALGYNIYFGSEYWALTYNCLKYLIEAYESDICLKRILKSSYVPSEAWIHTLFFNSKYRDKGIVISDGVYKGLSELSPLTYFVYKDAIKILDEKDYDDIVQSRKPFARKIIVGKSKKLIDQLNKDRIGKI